MFIVVPNIANTYTEKQSYVELKYMGYKKHPAAHILSLKV